MSQKKNELTFKYIYTYDYNPDYVNGAHGGISPRGELVINFYLERQPLPNAISHEIAANGMVGPEASVEPTDLNSSMVRYVSNGVVLNYQTAREIHYWMGEKIKELESMAEARAAMHADQASAAPGVTH